MANETTQEHVEFFAAECLRLQKLFRLDGWDLQIQHGTGQDANCDALLDTQLEGRVLVLCIAQWLSRKPTKSYLRKIARHEMIHALMQPMSRLARDRWCTHEQMDAASHETVHRLDALLPR